MRLLISEVLQKVSNAKTKAEKIAILREHETQTLRSILLINFDETVISRLPPGEDIPYRPNDAPKGTEHTLLESSGSKLYYYFKGGDDSLSNLKVEAMFIALLEGLHAEEAELLVKTINKTLGKKYRITLPVVKEAFPQITWGNRS